MGSDHSPKHVHFRDDFAPSVVSLRFTLGPKERPNAVIKISVVFEQGRLPSIQVQIRRRKERRRPRREEDRKERRRAVSDGIAGKEYDHNDYDLRHG